MPLIFCGRSPERRGLELLDFFVDECLPRFGDFQDAMHPEYWSMYHARISFCMNAKLISPMEVIRAVEDKWRADPDHADITQVEGFIRQVLGWREYMRGVYWAHMPEYADLNFFRGGQGAALNGFGRGDQDGLPRATPFARAWITATPTTSSA